MFDTMTLTKVTAGLSGALLIFLLGKWAADEMYAADEGGSNHEEEQVQGYKIEIEEVSSGGDEEEGPSLEDMIAEADLGKGEKVFGKCKACHKLEDGSNATGPYLFGVVGRDVGAATGYSSYSGALNEAADVWTAEALDGFLTSPKKYAPGTSMAFSGLSKPKDRANLIAFLDSLDN